MRDWVIAILISLMVVMAMEWWMILIAMILVDRNEKVAIVRTMRAFTWDLLTYSSACSVIQQVTFVANVINVWWTIDKLVAQGYSHELLGTSTTQWQKSIDVRVRFTYESSFAEAEASPNSSSSMSCPSVHDSTTVYMYVKFAQINVF